MAGSLPVLNLSEAKYECIFGRGCDGICCQNGRPPVYPEERERLDANLDKVCAVEGDKYRYKPAACALFPLARDEHDQWYVRQKDYKGEDWDLFCLDPKASPVPAAEALQAEIELARRYTEEETASAIAERS